MNDLLQRNTASFLRHLKNVAELALGVDEHLIDVREVDDWVLTQSESRRVRQEIEPLLDSLNAYGSAANAQQKNLDNMCETVRKMQQALLACNTQLNSYKLEIV
jgi:hypothetical protein